MKINPYYKKNNYFPNKLLVIQILLPFILVLSLVLKAEIFHCLLDIKFPTNDVITLIKRRHKGIKVENLSGSNQNSSLK